tara:strand:- start:1042 stop:2004 length:963 start_codon:yes stop_codon:yes gene_type:complete
MAQYVKATNFASKDALLTGDPNKIVKGAEIDDEFNNIQTGINSKADTLSPTLTGTPLAPTATAGTITTQIATTSFVGTAVTNGVATGKVSPVFTGTPTAPTAAVGNNTTQLATTAFVNAEIANDITAPLALKAPLASPALTGTPTAPTATAGTNTTQVATTAFVKTAVDNYDAALTVSTSQIENDAVTTAKIAPTGVSANTYGSATAIPVVTVNAEGQVTSATTAAITIADPIGVNQTWQTPSRSLGTTYTNSTGRPIQVTASVKNTASAVVGGVTIFDSNTVSCCGVPQISYFPLSFIVPDNTTYVINGAGLNVWAELR